MGRVPSGRLRCKPHGGITLRNSPATGGILDQLAANDDHLRDLARSGSGHYESGDGRRTDDLGSSTSPQSFGRARQVITEANRSGLLPDHAAERATNLVEQGAQGERSLAARWAIAAGDQHYANAFAKLVADPVRGHLLWTPREAEAYRVAVGVQGELEERAPMTLTGANGGHMVPLVLDPAIMLTSAGSINPLRQISRVVQTTGSQWSGVTSAGVTAEWKAEGVQAADAGQSPTSRCFWVMLSSRTRMRWGWTRSTSCRSCKRS
jgi:predicted phage gp36 major capsid-like protein